MWQAEADRNKLLASSACHGSGPNSVTLTKLCYKTGIAHQSGYFLLSPFWNWTDTEPIWPCQRSEGWARERRQPGSILRRRKEGPVRQLWTNPHSRDIRVRQVPRKLRHSHSAVLQKQIRHRPPRYTVTELHYLRYTLGQENLCDLSDEGSFICLRDNSIFFILLNKLFRIASDYIWTYY